MMTLEIFLRLHSFENKYYLQHHLGGVSVQSWRFSSCDKLAPNTRPIPEYVYEAPTLQKVPEPKKKRLVLHFRRVGSPAAGTPIAFSF